MTLGIKAGPQSSSIPDLEATRAPFCEVWYDINRTYEYRDLFNYARNHNIRVGLHFWGVLPDGTWTNISHPDLSEKSVSYIKKTIDIAAQNKCVYVNIHPGSRAKVSLNFRSETFKLLSEPVDLSISTGIFRRNLDDLDRYAKLKDMPLIVETLPSRVVNNYSNPVRDRESAINIYELPNTVILDAAGAGFRIANDFGHTAASVITDDVDSVWKYLLDFTRAVAKQTKLIHLGFLVPPYNGTDFHDTLANPLFETPKAVPNKKQILELLKIFRNRPDTYILVEPNGGHAENYFLAKKLLDEAGV